MKLNIHLIPTNELSRIWGSDKVGFKRDETESVNYAHQVILTSEEPPKVGDFQLNNLTSKISRRTNLFTEVGAANCFKIIAADPQIQGVPQLSDSDIEYCLKLYNEGVREVECETTTDFQTDFPYQYEQKETILVFGLGNGFIQLIQPTESKVKKCNSLECYMATEMEILASIKADTLTEIKFSIQDMEACWEASRENVLDSLHPDLAIPAIDFNQWLTTHKQKTT